MCVLNRLLMVAALLAWGISSSPSNAARTGQSFEQVVAFSDLIIVGEVIHQYTDGDQGQNTAFTISSVAVTQVLKGSVGSIPVIRVRTEGGEVPDPGGGSPILQSGQVDGGLQVGETVVLFLSTQVCQNTTQFVHPVPCMIASDCNFGACSGTPSRCADNADLLCTISPDCVGTCGAPPSSQGVAQIYGGPQGKYSVVGGSVLETGDTLGDFIILISDIVAQL